MVKKCFKLGVIMMMGIVLLVGGTLIGALVCDLVVLPACLLLGGSMRKARAA